MWLTILQFGQVEIVDEALAGIRRADLVRDDSGQYNERTSVTGLELRLPKLVALGLLQFPFSDAVPVSVIVLAMILGHPLAPAAPALP